MLCKKLSLQKLGFIVFQVLCSGTVCWFIKVNRLLNVEGAYNALKPKNLSHGRIRHSRVIRIWATFGFAGIFNICNHMSIASCKCCVNKSFTSSPHINSMFFVVFINFGDKPHISYPTAIIIDQSKTYRSHVSFAEPWVCVYVITFRRKQGGIKLMMFNVQKTKMCDIGTKPAAFGRVSNSCMYSRSRFYIRDLSIRASGIGEPTSESIQPCVKLILLSKVSLLPCRWHNKMNRSFVSNFVEMSFYPNVWLWSQPSILQFGKAAAKSDVVKSYSASGSTFAWVVLIRPGNGPFVIDLTNAITNLSLSVSGRRLKWTNLDICVWNCSFFTYHRFRLLSTVLNWKNVQNDKFQYFYILYNLNFYLIIHPTKILLLIIFNMMFMLCNLCPKKD